MSKATILVVDDEPDILLTTKVLLERSGYEVITATNGFATCGSTTIVIRGFGNRSSSRAARIG